MQEGRKPSASEVECVLKFPLPKTPKQIKEFLGLAGYYSKLINDYSYSAKPLTRYLKKNAKINVNDLSYQKSFDILKRILANHSI